MRTKSKMMTIVLTVLLFGAVVVGCSGSRNPNLLGSVQQADIVAYEIRNLPDTINVGDVVQARAFAIFDDGSEEDFTLALTWASSDSSVAAVDPFYPGQVTGISPGQARIRAYETPVEGYKDITVQ